MADNSTQHPQGSTLIIALMLLALMGFIVGIITAVITNSVRSTRNYSNAFRATYALEGGEEYGLYALYSSRYARTQGAEETVTAISGLSDTYINGANYSLSAEVQQENMSFEDIADNDSVQFDVFAEDYSSGYRLQPLSTVDPVHVIVDWEEALSCGPGTSNLELSFTKWSPLVWEDFLDISDFQNKWVVQCTAGRSCQYTHQLDPGYLYRVRAKALNCDFSEMDIRFENASTGASLYALNYIVINATGEYDTSREEGFVASPWTAPIIDYYDYVIFSEQDLLK